jgi:cytochrome P450
MAETFPEITFFDPSANDCPYDAYRQLRDEAPVWLDPATGMYVLTRYEDVRAVVLDQERFTNQVVAARANAAVGDALELQEAAELEQELARMYEQRGWLPGRNVVNLDEPEHMQMRRLFDYAFRPAVIRQLDPFVDQVANRLLDEFLAGGRCDWVRQYAVPLPMHVIAHQVGIDENEMPRIKRWTDAYVKRMGLTQTRAERIWSAEMEIEAQHYFQPIIERLRKSPDDSLFSALVNGEIPEWGRPLTDNELHHVIMVHLFVAGSETTANALSAGMAMLAQRPDVWHALKSDPSARLEPFIEEVLRLESPVQGLLRQAAVDVELHGTQIPAGSLIMIRFGAANRDERQFADAPEIDLDRRQPRSHLAFGTGAHHCLGAPLVRRELYYGFRAALERIDEVWLIEAANDFKHAPNYFLRALNELHIEFRPSG